MQNIATVGVDQAIENGTTNVVVECVPAGQRLSSDVLEEGGFEPFENQEATAGLGVGPNIENPHDVGVVEPL